MRKRTISCLVDEIFWGIVYLLPIVIILLVTFRTGNVVDFNTAMSSVGLGVLSDNYVFTCLSDLIGSAGVVPLFNSGMIYFFSYFITCWLCHVIVDVLLWIPRWCHSLISKVGN